MKTETETDKLEKLTQMHRWSNGFYGRYRGHSIAVERDHPSRDWYILVISDGGGIAYDGWWRKSGTLAEAIEQAVTGSGLRAKVRQDTPAKTPPSQAAFLTL